MASRRLHGLFALTLLLASTSAIGCKDKGKGDATKAKATASDLDRRCEQVAMACGDKDKHVERILDACKQATTKQIANGCLEQAITTYDCYEKQLCGKGDKVWALDDFGVLAARHKLCVAEQTALRACMDKK